MIILLNAACGQSCPTGWAMENCKCFKIFPTAATHEEGEAGCVKSGGHLASATNQDIHDRLLFLGQQGGTDFWIGLNDVYTEGTYVWPNGADYGSYTNWATSPHTPDASLQFVKVGVTSEKWENIVGETSLHYACEVELDRRVETVLPSCIKDGDYCFTLKTVAATWDNAVTSCKDEGGYLATVPVANTGNTLYLILHTSYLIPQFLYLILILHIW